MGDQEWSFNKPGTEKIQDNGSESIEVRDFDPWTLHKNIVHVESNVRKILSMQAELRHLFLSMKHPGLESNIQEQRSEPHVFRSETRGAESKRNRGSCKSTATDMLSSVIENNNSGAQTTNTLVNMQTQITQRIRNVTRRPICRSSKFATRVFCLTKSEEKRRVRDILEGAAALDPYDVDENPLWRRRVHKMKQILMNSSVEAYVDSFVLVVIALNAIFIGFSMDLKDDAWSWFAADALFSAIFCGELVFKVRLHSFRGYFSSCVNYFDAMIVVLDLIQLIMETMVDKGHGPDVSVLRLIRLAKIVRLAKMLQHDVFRDLIYMIQGLKGGLTTLGWALILFILIVYVASLIFREMLGRSIRDRENIWEHFCSVPDAMFTVFRCSFGDCSSSLGMPIFEHVKKRFGLHYCAAYSVLIFIISIGIFNVISAIFVESTMLAASNLQKKKAKNKMMNEELWNRNVTILLQSITDMMGLGIDVLDSDSFEIVFELEVPKEVIRELTEDPKTHRALLSLDISTLDMDQLAELLDPDGGGTIRVHEFLVGLRCLRGDPRRSDIISVDLLVRQLTRMISEFQDEFAAHKAIQSEEKSTTAKQPWMDPSCSFLSVANDIAELDVATPLNNLTCYAVDTAGIHPLKGRGMTVEFSGSTHEL